MGKVPKVKFYNGNEVPAIGLGTWRAAPNEAYHAVRDAIDIGYRFIDNAHLYENEAEVGQAVREKIEEGVIKREDIFVSNKLWNNAHNPESVEPTLRKTLKNLGLDYVDMYLIHWPMAYKEGSGFHPTDENGKLIFADYDYVDTWKAMEKVYEKGLTKNIGISNFNEEQIERILKVAKIKPVTNQVECQPYFNQIEFSKYCASKGITITAYRPLGGAGKPGLPKPIDDENIKNIAKKYNKTAAQILLRYQIERGHIVIPKSTSKSRIQENFNIFDFSLAKEDIEAIQALECDLRLCPMLECIDSPDYPFRK